jgi:xanthine/uracil/vitamin C permease (AzgA family)
MLKGTSTTDTVAINLNTGISSISDSVCFFFCYFIIPLLFC